ncbi:MAG: DUF192 domain-containing protein [Treponema sp.]|jgi:uncharacterized membrane protein (UPF0127 family)|nr:DUF192 domain-containing protein [Treponema sp.]
MNYNLMNHKRILPALLALFLFVNCAAGGREKPQTGLDLRTLTIERAGGGKVNLEAEIARTDEERSAGLMFRKALPGGRGMLFVFDRDQVLSFWMKNTLIPLSIAFISYDGTIQEIRDMYPQDLSSVHSSRSVRYALEVPQGWFAESGIKAGDLVTGL